MDIQILHSPGCAAARVQLNPREKFVAESGAMISMDSHLNVVTTSKSKGGGFLKGITRILAMESFFLNHFTAPAQGGHVMFAPTLAGDLKVHYLDGTKNLMIQGSSFVGASDDVQIDITTQGLKSSFFSGEHIFWLNAHGNGPIILSSFGGIYEKEINGSYVVDTGHIVAFENTLKFEVKKAAKKGWIASMLSGEGLVCHFEGQGKLYCQTHNPSSFGMLIGPKLRPR